MSSPLVNVQNNLLGPNCHKLNTVRTYWVYSLISEVIFVVYNLFLLLIVRCYHSCGELRWLLDSIDSREQWVLGVGLRTENSVCRSLLSVRSQPEITSTYDKADRRKMRLTMRLEMTVCRWHVSSSYEEGGRSSNRTRTCGHYRRRHAGRGETDRLSKYGVEAALSFDVWMVITSSDYNRREYYRSAKVDGWAAKNYVVWRAGRARAGLTTLSDVVDGTNSILRASPSTRHTTVWPCGDLRPSWDLTLKESFWGFWRWLTNGGGLA